MLLEMRAPGALELDVNGEKRTVLARPADTLLHVLRPQLGLTGAQPGCEYGDCGACTVLVDGWPVKSCLMLAVEAVGRQATTVEGLRGADTEGVRRKTGFQLQLLHVRFHDGLPFPGDDPPRCRPGDDQQLAAA